MIKQKEMECRGMKLSKRILAALLSVCMLASSGGMQAEAYDKMSSDSEKVESRTEQELLEDRVEESLQDGRTGVRVPESRTEQETERTAEQNQTQEWETGVLNFIMQESEQIQVPGVQNVAASLGAEGEVVTQAWLQYKNTVTGQEFTTEAAGIAENMVRFSMEYNREEQKGLYELTGITWKTDRKSCRVLMSETDMRIVYGVNQAVETEPDEVLLNQELLEQVEANVVTLDENGRASSGNTMERVLDNAQAGSGLSLHSMTRGAKKMVIVLDPGHDSTHSGAGYNGLKEENLVLKIAQYCKTELQKYNGVSVYMTRETVSCANGGKSVDAATCNARRVEFAAGKKANVYVSFHLNASASSSANGIGVYYPNSNYRPAIGTEGKGLATEIYRKLAALGLATWAGGILIRNSQDNSRYPDGSLADYLAIIRRSKLAGFPAVLIEHAFISNTGDVNKFLNSDAKLKKLGVADAQGIAAYYGLSLKSDGGDDSGDEEREGEIPEISYVQSRNSSKLRVRWEDIPEADFYRVYRSTSENGSYSEIARVTGTSYDNSNLKAGKKYYYKLCAVYADETESELSEPVSGKTLAQPTLTKVISKTNEQINLTWTSVKDAKKYEIYRSESEEEGYEKIATLKAGQTTYMDREVEAHQTYLYKVRVRGGEQNGFSSFSNIYSGWAVKKTKVLSVTAKGKGALRITWKRNPKAYAYRIQRSTSQNRGYKTVATVKSKNTTSYTDRNLKSGQRYYYKIQVLNRVNRKTGYSGYCKPVAGTAK